MNQSASELWAQFKQQTDITTESYDSWSFGDSPTMADSLLKYVIEGEKRGTSSTKLAYQFSQEAFPKVGKYSVIVDGKGIAQAILRTKVIDILPYNHVSELHAYLEGEGDRSLAYWRSVHQPFFENELSQYGVEFSEDLLIVYEFFELVFKNNKYV